MLFADSMDYDFFRVNIVIGIVVVADSLLRTAINESVIGVAEVGLYSHWGMMVVYFFPFNISFVFLVMKLSLVFHTYCKVCFTVLFYLGCL